MGYPFEHAWKHERERLGAIEGGLDASTISCLTIIGVEPGWRCLEVGAGAGSIAGWLCRRVGPSGWVVATDLETGFLDALSEANLEVRRHDVTADPLETSAFDLVHARKVLEHLARPERALARLVEAARPGGFVCVEDADLSSLRHCSTPDPDLFARGYDAFLAAMVANGYHAQLGLHLGDLLRRAGLRDVQVRGFVGEWTGAGPTPSVYLRTFEKIRDRVVARGDLAAEEADRFLAAIRAPDFRAITAVHFAAWGRRPEAPGGAAR